MEQTLKIIAIIILSYLFGNISFALIIAKLKHRDLRKLGSGNLGTMNVTRNLGIKLGVLTLVLDAIKGAVPCLLGWYILGDLTLGGSRLGGYIGAASVVLGHVYPVFLKFKGGKGIASTIGACIVLQPLVGILAFVGSLIFITITSMGSITSFIAISIPIVVEALRINETVTNANEKLISLILMFSLLVFTLLAHRKNFVKLFKGTESRTVVIKKKIDREEEKLKA